jgi:hypothetical protein
VVLIGVQNFLIKEEYPVMSAVIAGDCICGAVRYECSAEPAFSANCHCRDCQKAVGGAFSPALVVSTAALKVTGKAKYFDTEGDSGHSVSRGFCPQLRPRLFGKSAAMPEFTAIMAGSLDEPSRYRPAMDIYTASAQPWDYMNPVLPN